MTPGALSSSKSSPRLGLAPPTSSTMTGTTALRPDDGTPPARLPPPVLPFGGGPRPATTFSFPLYKQSAPPEPPPVRPGPLDLQWMASLPGPTRPGPRLGPSGRLLSRHGPARLGPLATTSPDLTRTARSGLPLVHPATPPVGHIRAGHITPRTHHLLAPRPRRTSFPRHVPTRVGLGATSATDSV